MEPKNEPEKEQNHNKRQLYWGFSKYSFKKVSL